MDNDQACRAKALEIAFIYKGTQQWRVDTIMKWAFVFYMYIKEGSYTNTNPEQTTPR